MSDTSEARLGKLRLRSGVRLHYATSGAAGGDPVVLLHGWPDSSFSFSRAMPLLPGHLRAFAFDQRGFGESDRPESDYSISEYGEDVIAFLDALGLERATLVGHSFGSFVARQAAIAHPLRVKGLVLIGTGFSTSNAVTRELQASLSDLPDPIPVDFAREFQAGTIHHPLPPEFFDRLVAESLKLPPRLWRLTIDRLLEHDDRQEIARIDAPTLLLWGERDALFSREDQDRFIAALPAARLEVISETGHSPNWERPERVAAAIASFLATLPR